MAAIFAIWAVALVVGFCLGALSVLYFFIKPPSRAEWVEMGMTNEND